MPKKIPTSEQMTLPGTTPDESSSLSAEQARTQLSARKGSKRQDYANMRRAQAIKAKAQQGSGDISAQPKKKSLAERSNVLRETHGFYPVTRPEASQAFGLLHDLGKPTSTIKYLNEVLLHQAKPDVDVLNSARTPLGLVRQFGNHAADARITRILVNDLLQRVDGINPKLKMIDLKDEVPLDLLIPLYRNNVINAAVKSSNFNPSQYEDMGSALDFDYMVAPIEGSYLDVLTDYASSMTVFGARLAADEVDTQQAHRSQFWDARVAEAYGHLATRDAVRMVGGVAARTYYVEPSQLSQAMNE
jgi:hypothetical protein